MHKFFFLALVILMRACYAYEIQDVSQENRQRLDQFFKFLITRTSFGYTLCGEKPCAIETYPMLSKTLSRYAVKIFFKYPGYSNLIQGWEVWSKYAKYFTSKNFVFRYVSEYQTFVLINKRATRKVIEEI